MAGRSVGLERTNGGGARAAGRRPRKKKWTTRRRDEECGRGRGETSRWRRRRHDGEACRRRACGGRGLEPREVGLSSSSGNSEEKSERTILRRDGSEGDGRKPEDGVRCSGGDVRGECCCCCWAVVWTEPSHGSLDVGLLLVLDGGFGGLGFVVGGLDDVDVFGGFDGLELDLGDGFGGGGDEGVVELGAEEAVDDHEDLGAGLDQREEDDDAGGDEAPHDGDENPEGEIILGKDAGRRREDGPEHDDENGEAPADAGDPGLGLFEQFRVQVFVRQAGLVVI
mmetsp:Transcript_25770/g.79281  ORF Transcript_25770/g.79281 Transcript_25770/m.79281 type:complete len:282 (-) Transcript_25770:2007-2852(-)